MILRRQRLDYGSPWSLPNVYLFTGNPVRRRDGAIVMGRGAARQVRDTYPGVDRKLGEQMNGKPLVYVLIKPGQVLGWFQVKHHWQQPADLKLIASATELLRQHATRRQEVFFHLNAPGVGNGRLSWDDVEPILRALPDNVLVYL